jgi:hypothetical protein
MGLNRCRNRRGIHQGTRGQLMTPTGLALKVTNKDGRESFPCYEAFGWDKVNQIIANTLEIEHVLKVEIVDINVLR